MQTRKLGQSGIDVSVLGLGTVKFGRDQGVKYPESFTIPDDKQIIELLALSKDLGINLIDTAPAYGTSEQRVGELLNGQRHEWVLASKAGENFVNGESQFDFSKAGITASVERSLKDLQTDYLDILLIHSNGDDEKIIEQDEVFTTLATLKSAGKIRAYGMSSKTVAGGKLTVDQADVAMVTYHPGYTDELSIIEYAAQKQKGILIKKAFASGHLSNISDQDPVALTMKTILSQPGVSSIIMGTINPAHLRENVNAAQSALAAMSDIA